MGNPEKALGFYSRMIERSGFDTGGFIAKSTEAYNRIITTIKPRLYEMKKKVAASPNDLNLRGEFALKLDQLTLYEEALAEYRAMEQFGMKSWQLQFNIGNVCKKLKRYQEASLAYEKSLTMNPANKDAWNNLGVALKESKDYEKSLKALERAVAIDPGFMKARYNLVVTNSLMGRRDEASRLGEQLLKDAPEMSGQIYPLIRQQ
jgi:tetratricopeptide (TPR) repeat protein